VFVPCICFIAEKRTSLKWNIRLKQFLGFLILTFELPGRYEQDWVFDLSHPVQSNGMGFLKSTVPSQSHAVQSEKIPFVLVQQKLMFDDMAGPVVNEVEQDILFNLINLILSHLSD
jgi:hypothetical protein